MENLAANIRDARERSGMTQAAAAEKLGLKKATYASYERAKNAAEPPAGTLAKIAVLFRVSMDDLCCIPSPDLPLPRYLPLSNELPFIKNARIDAAGHVIATLHDGKTITFDDPLHYEKFKTNISIQANRARNAVFQAALDGLHELTVFGHPES